MNVSFLESQLAQESKELKHASLKKDLGVFISYAKVMWGYFGYSALSSVRPFFNDSPQFVLTRKKTRQKFLDFTTYLRDNDISMFAYCTIAFSILPDSNFGALSKCHSGKGERSWVKKLRKAAGSSQDLDKLAQFLMKFITLQVEKSGKAHISRAGIVKDHVGSSGKYLELYHKALQRIKALEDLNVDTDIWLEEKVKRCVEFYPNSPIHFSTIVNANGVDPDINELRKLSNDPWREIRQFLGLSVDCVFVDGYIPKGWGTASDDPDELKDITHVTGDGYYYYKDGTQRKGKRHYSTNLFFVIKCTPENFEEFKQTWWDPRRLSGSPTWTEYSKWGKTPDVWNVEGESVTGRVRPVKWRSK